MKDRFIVTNKLKPYITLVFVMAACFCMAQPSATDPTIFDPVDDVPIDGAIALLTLAGLGLGVKKLYQNKK
jgi:hypothetical protein